MPYCPKCKDEYREGFTVCKDCNELLVDALPEDALIMDVSPEEGFYIADDGPAFLCTVGDDIAASITESLLKSYNIPVMKKRLGTGDITAIYMGIASQGVDIFVPSKLLETAADILASESELDADFSDDEFARLKDEEQISRRQKARLLLIPAMSPLMGIMIFIVLVVTVLAFVFIK